MSEEEYLIQRDWGRSLLEFIREYPAAEVYEYAEKLHPEDGLLASIMQSVRWEVEGAENAAARLESLREAERAKLW